jgi:hypothetical protein
MTNIEATTPTIERPFLTRKLLAQRYDVCERTIQNWSNAGLLVYLKRRRVVRYYVPGCDASLVEHVFLTPAIHPLSPQSRCSLNDTPNPGNS